MRKSYQKNFSGEDAALKAGDYMLGVLEEIQGFLKDGKNFTYVDHHCKRLQTGEYEVLVVIDIE